jgi:hypothetical protein
MNTVHKKKLWFQKHLKSNTQLSSREKASKTLNKLQLNDETDHGFEKNSLNDCLSVKKKNLGKHEENFFNDSFFNSKVKILDCLTTNKLITSLFKYIKQKLSSSQYVINLLK